ncbi:hypothetical protein ACHAWF_016685 [Thalassiosira exigua]
MWQGHAKTLSEISSGSREGGRDRIRATGWRLRPTVRIDRTLGRSREKRSPPQKDEPPGHSGNATHHHDPFAFLGRRGSERRAPFRATDDAVRRLLVKPGQLVPNQLAALRLPVQLEDQLPGHDRQLIRQRPARVQERRRGGELQPVPVDEGRVGAADVASAHRDGVAANVELFEPSGGDLDDPIGIRSVATGTGRDGRGGRLVPPGVGRCGGPLGGRDRVHVFDPTFGLAVGVPRAAEVLVSARSVEVDRERDLRGGAGAIINRLDFGHVVGRCGTQRVPGQGHGSPALGLGGKGGLEVGGGAGTRIAGGRRRVVRSSFRAPPAPPGDLGRVEEVGGGTAVGRRRGGERREEREGGKAPGATRRRSAAGTAASASRRAGGGPRGPSAVLPGGGGGRGAPVARGLRFEREVDDQARPRRLRARRRGAEDELDPRPGVDRDPDASSAFPPPSSPSSDCGRGSGRRRGADDPDRRPNPDDDGCVVVVFPPPVVAAAAVAAAETKEVGVSTSNALLTLEFVVWLFAIA